jgi:hypothetical protein
VKRENDQAPAHNDKLPPEALRWLAEVERIFPGSTKSVVVRFLEKKNEKN